MYKIGSDSVSDGVQHRSGGVSVALRKFNELKMLCKVA
jgi:hypothetical protein